MSAEYADTVSVAFSGTCSATSSSVVRMTGAFAFIVSLETVTAGVWTDAVFSPPSPLSEIVFVISQEYQPKVCAETSFSYFESTAPVIFVNSSFSEAL